jgi:arylsulfatase A-like enzyme
MRLTAEEEESLRARYDGGVHSADQAAARLVAAVAAQGRPFVAMITADHGESLGEEGRWFHGRGLPHEVLAVPLIVLGEGVEAAVVRGPVGHAAVAPTLLASAGIGGSECRGVDLRRDSGTGIAEGGLPPHLAYRIGGGYKLVLDLESGRRTLFDVRADPLERHNLAGAAEDVADALAVGLRGGPSPDPPSWEIRERLRALGYAGP